MTAFDVLHPSQLSEQARERVRGRSKLLFGSADRLEVSVAIALADDGVANATDLQWDLHLAANRVRAQLLALTAAELLVEGPPGVRGKRMFVRAESAFWPFCIESYTAAAGDRPANG